MAHVLPQLQQQLRSAQRERQRPPSAPSSTCGAAAAAGVPAPLAAQQQGGGVARLARLAQQVGQRQRGLRERCAPLLQPCSALPVSQSTTCGATLCCRPPTPDACSRPRGQLRLASWMLENTSKSRDGHWLRAALRQAPCVAGTMRHG